MTLVQIRLITPQLYNIMPKTELSKCKTMLPKEPFLLLLQLVLLLDIPNLTQ